MLHLSAQKDDDSGSTFLISSKTATLAYTRIVNSKNHFSCSCESVLTVSVVYIEAEKEAKPKDYPCEHVVP